VSADVICNTLEVQLVLVAAACGPQLVNQLIGTVDVQCNERAVDAVSDNLLAQPWR